MGETDILFELFHTVSMAVFCVGLVFCLACVLDARKYDDINNDWP